VAGPGDHVGEGVVREQPDDRGGKSRALARGGLR
jgi:hypothetical protein